MLNNISGFPEFLPAEQIVFNQIVEQIKQQFELYGFSPLDTPAVEKASTLLAKGNDNEIYGIYRLAASENETKKKDLALRFDLTVPLARYVAQNYGSLTFPYKRYHIAPVWRGERAQAGRYRQFYQCDIDVIGNEELALIYDAELLLIIYQIFKNINLKNFVIKINNRYILTGLIKSFALPDVDIAAIIRVIDKAEKITRAVFSSELLALGLKQDNLNLLLDLLDKKMSNAEWILYLQNLCAEPEFLRGVTELAEVLKSAHAFAVNDLYIQIDPTLARGLNYYTGTIFETKLTDYPELGSVCGGGRYANLASNFTNKKLPGVGISIGISRLIPKLIEAQVLKADRETPAKVLVTVQNINCIEKYMQIAASLRTAQINTELYLANNALGAQMKYASKKGFRFVIIADQTELNDNQAWLRDMQKGEQALVPITDLTKLLI